MVSKWNYIFVILVILIGALSVANYLTLKNTKAILRSHEDKYYSSVKIEDRLRFLRNDIKYYIDRERNVSEILERLDLIELEESR